jgi:hypothetical protein
MRTTLTSLSLSLATVALLACSSDTTAPGGNGANPGKGYFPRGVTLASPLAASKKPATANRSRSVFPEWLVRTAHASGTYTSAFAESTKTVAGVLDGTASVADAFDANAFGRKLDLTTCYGPTMAYTDHPDGAPGASGTLPQGDLGLWLENEPSTGDACAAAELNSLFASDAGHAQAVLVALAKMASILSGSLPAAGSTASALAGMNALGLVGVMFTKADLSLDATGKTWSYALEFTAPGSHTIAVTMTHTPGASDDEYTGAYTVAVDGEPPFPNCSTASTVDALSATYTRVSATSLAIASRRGTYCATSLAGLPAAILGSDGLLDPAQKMSGALPSGWGGNFGRFGASFNPESTTLQGDYAYAWQAGPDDGHTRVFNLRINGASADGEAFFGFGDDVASTDGSILGMICNWAGPGGSRAVNGAYAERQFVAFDATTGKWSQPPGGSDMRYAPTNDCVYTNAEHAAGATFWYDRAITGAASGMTSDPTLIVDPTDATYPLDLFDKGASATIADAISARGGKLPPKL